MTARVGNQAGQGCVSGPVTDPSKKKVTESAAVKVSGLIIGLMGLGVLAGCGERETYLPGQREELRAITADGGVEEINGQANRSAPIALPKQSANADWTSGIGTASTRASHPALSGAPALQWTASIGAGDSRKARINANPVVAGGRIFTLDSGAQVMAHSTAGATLWSVDLTPPTDRAGDASGGGIAFGDGKVFVSSGFGLLTALDPANGAVVWQQDLTATGTGTPTVAGDLVYLMAGDDTAWAVETDTGRVRWQLSATPDVANVLGAPAPAVGDKFVIFAFGDGDVQAAFKRGGLRMWSTQVSGQRKLRALSKIGDITGDPVLSGDRVYVGTSAGRLVALNAGNGEREWTAKEGAVGPVWPVGGSVFAVTDLNELVRLDATTGERIWGVDLPGFTSNKPRRQAAIYGHSAPVLAGGRIVVASGDGQLRFFDPANGNLVQSVEVPGGATTAPVVAGGVLYVVSKRGQLHAFR